MAKLPTSKIPANVHAAPPSARQELDVHPQVSSRRLQPLTWQHFLSQVKWFNLTVEALLPLLSLYGLCTTRWSVKTAVFTVACYILNMIGESPFYSTVMSCGELISPSVPER